MTALSSRDIESYLGDYGWTYTSDRRNEICTGWQGDARSYPLSIKLTDTWVLFRVTPLMRLGVDWDAWPELSKFLLELNNDCQMIKLGIDEFGEISLTLQLFNNSMSYEEFSDALGVIGHYGERLYEDLTQFLNETGFYLNSGGAAYC